MARRCPEQERERIFAVMEQQAWAHGVQCCTANKKPETKQVMYGPAQDEAMVMRAIADLADQQPTADED